MNLISVATELPRAEAIPPSASRMGLLKPPEPGAQLARGNAGAGGIQQGRDQLSVRFDKFGNRTLASGEQLGQPLRQQHPAAQPRLGIDNLLGQVFPGDGR